MSGRSPTKGVTGKRSRIIQVGLLVLVALVASAVVATLAFGRSSAGPPPNPGPPTNSSSTPGQLTISDAPTSITIKVASFSWGVSNPTTTGTGGGGGTGKASFSSLNVLGPIDASFPVLNAAVAAGKHFPSVVLTFTLGNGTVTYQLDNVLIESDQQSGGGDGANSLSLAFRKIQWAFTDASGTATSKGWDVVANTAI